MSILANKRQLLCCSVLVAASWAFPAAAQERMFRLPAGDAVHAIPKFAQQSGLQIIAPADRLNGIRTPSIVGKYDVRAALRQLIKNTDLVIASDGGKIIVLKEQRPSTMRSTPRVQLASAERFEMAMAQCAQETRFPRAAWAGDQNQFPGGKLNVRWNGGGV